MSGDKPGRNRIRIEQVCIGLHVKLDTWLGHPFLLSSFKIKDERQIAALRSMGLTEIEYLPEKSDASPAPPPSAFATSASAVHPAESAEDAEALEALMREKRGRIETLNRERERIRIAERQYLKTANGVQNVMRLSNNNPAQAARLSGEIAGELAELFLAEQEPYIHLMGENVADESASARAAVPLAPREILWRATYRVGILGSASGSFRQPR